MTASPQTRNTRALRARSLSSVLAATALSTLLSAAPDARSDATQAVRTSECSRSHEAAQRNRFEGKLLMARDELRHCSTATCPVLIQNDCTTWLATVVEMIPTVLFEAKIGEDDVFDVTVVLDGKVVATQLDGQRVEVDPGIHTVVFERTGFQSIEKKIIVAPRSAQQLIGAAWKAPDVAAPAPRSVSRTLIPTPERHGVSVGRIAGWIGIAVGVAGIATGTVAGVEMFSDRDAARAACPDNQCRPGGRDDISHAQTEATFSTIAFGVGVAATALGAYFLLRPEAKRATAALSRLGVVPLATHREGGLWIRGDFQ